jgi:uncharacterized membrane protein HdeD (DUF308 family)
MAAKKKKPAETPVMPVVQTSESKGPNVGKVAKVFLGVLVMLAGFFLIWTFLPEFIFLIKALIGVVLVLIGLLVVAIGWLD